MLIKYSVKFYYRMNDELNYVDLICPDLFLEDPIFANLFPIEAAQPLPSVQELKLITDRLESLEHGSATYGPPVHIIRPAIL